MRKVTCVALQSAGYVQRACVSSSNGEEGVPARHKVQINIDHIAPPVKYKLALGVRCVAALKRCYEHGIFSVSPYMRNNSESQGQ